MGFGPCTLDPVHPWHEVNSFTHSLTIYGPSTRGQALCQAEQVTWSLCSRVLQMHSWINAINPCYSDFMKRSIRDTILSLWSQWASRTWWTCGSFLCIQTPPMPLWLLTLFGKAALHKLLSDSDQLTQHGKFMYIISSKLETENTILRYKSPMILKRERKNYVSYVQSEQLSVVKDITGHLLKF